MAPALDTYQVIFQNNSVNAWSVCVYQSAPDVNVPNVQSLAWLTEMAAPTTQVVFDWQIQYNFVWSNQGTLPAGAVFQASQCWDADLITANAVTLTNPGGYYTFQNQTVGPAPGSLYITEDNTIPVGGATVGVGMSGNGTFVLTAGPNLNLIFTPTPTYWITFGQYIQGQVMSETEITNSAMIEFPPDVFTMYATLNANNTWTISQTAP